PFASFGESRRDAHLYHRAISFSQQRRSFLVDEDQNRSTEQSLQAPKKMHERQTS
uniref:Uncharacterized protein n=1 Tax=Parascaris equorum TaxID=6256 RepID=A0A914R944_PAREQ